METFEESVARNIEARQLSFCSFVFSAQIVIFVTFCWVVVNDLMWQKYLHNRHITNIHNKKNAIFTVMNSNGFVYMYLLSLHSTFQLET